jgi:F-type H+-transporting ATPase subunit b
MIAASRKEAEDMVASARREIDQAKAAAVGELQKRAVDLAFDLTNRLIRKNLSPADHEELIRERLNDLPPAGGPN